MGEEMLITKFTEGHVKQVWDTEKECWVSQEFTAGDDCEYAYQDGKRLVIADPAILWPDGDEPYLPYKMTLDEGRPTDISFFAKVRKMYDKVAVKTRLKAASLN